MDHLPRVFLKSVFNYVFKYDHDSELRQLSGQLSVFIQEKEKHIHNATLSLYVSPRSSTIHAEFLCCTKDEYINGMHVLDVGSQLEECLQQVIKAKQSGFFNCVCVHLQTGVPPRHPSLTSFDSRCPRFRKLLQLCTCSRKISVDALQTDTPGGADFDISWLFDNLLRKDICLTQIKVGGRSNNLWNSLLDLLRDRISSEPPRITIRTTYEDVPEEHVLRLLKLKTVERIYFFDVDSHHYSSVIQEWEKDVDSVKAKCIWGHRDGLFVDDFVNGFEELKDAPPLFERHARKVATFSGRHDLKKGNYYIKEHPTERGRKLYLWLNKYSTVYYDIRGREENRSTDVVLCF